MIIVSDNDYNKPKYFKKMSNYPLSTKSSKKSHKNASQLHSPALLERSACQNAHPQPLKSQDYRHILVGERVFIELYYQGRVVTTAYNEYITFMGGILSKRLTQKVTIFLTNIDTREIGPIKERVRRICPNCRIINILWFQQCYQQKQKVSFDEFAVDVENEQQEQVPKAERVDEGDFNDLLGNICEDVENEFKEFFKNQKKKYFENLPKSHNKTASEVLPAKDIDLGPNPQKKLRPKNENNKRRRKSVSRQQGLSQKKGLMQSRRQLKSLGPEMSKEIEDEDEQTKNENVDELPQQNLPFPHNQGRQSSLENLMSKYLGPSQKCSNNTNSLESPLSATIKSRRSPIVSENEDTTSKALPSQTKKVPQLLKQPPLLFKKSVHSACTQLDPYKANEKHRFTFSVLGTKYKDIAKGEEEIPIDPLQLEKFIETFKRRDQNSLVIVAPTRVLELRVKEINAEATFGSSIKLYILPYKLFKAFSQRIKEEVEIYFLLNNKRVSERALYYSLQLQKSSLRLKVVSHRLIEEVMAYNHQVKNYQSHTPIKLQKSRIKFLRELNMEVQMEYIRGKKITFLQSELPPSLQKKIVEALGGEFVLKQDYLFTTHLDMIVTDRFGLKQKGVQTVSQQIFWKRLIRLQGDSQ